LTISEAGKVVLIEDIQNKVNFVYNNFTPDLKVWRAGEGFERKLPYMAIDFIQTSDRRYSSLADIVGRIDDLRYEYAYCEIVLVNITIYAEKYHDSNRGREYASEIIERTRTRILAYWNEFLYKYNASVDRSQPAPIRDLTSFNENVGTRVHEFDLNVYLRTDVRWHRDLSPEDKEEERAKNAYIILNNKNNIIITS